MDLAKRVDESISFMSACGLDMNSSVMKETEFYVSHEVGCVGGQAECWRGAERSQQHAGVPLPAGSWPGSAGDCKGAQLQPSRGGCEPAQLEPNSGCSWVPVCQQRAVQQQ
jgi:hypothetical protein